MKLNRIKKKVLPLVMAVMMMGATVSASHAAASVDVLKGANRFATASEIAKGMTPANALILVNSDRSLADGLSASGLSAALKKAPILLVHKDSIPNETQLVIEGSKNIYLIGSYNSISQKMEASLKNAGFNVTRIGGGDRYETSTNIAKEILRIKKSIGKVFLANGYKGEADAMSISAVAARDGEPVLLTNGKNLDRETASIVDQTRKIFVIGGMNSVSPNLVGELNAKRIDGADRFATNVNVVKEFYPNHPNKIFLSDAYKLVDALTGGPLAGSMGSPIVYVSAKSNKSILQGASELVALGGINNNVLKSCAAAAGK